MELTTRSVAGLSAEQLGAKLRCRCHSVLVQLCRQGRLSRQKLGSAHVYFARDPEIASLQRQAVEGVQLPAEIAVLILAQFIRSPECGFEQLAQAISRQTAVTIQAAQIERLFEQQGLKKKDPNIAANALKVLGDSLARLSQETLPSALFPQPPVVRFASQIHTCPCGERLLVQKTRSKKVLSMLGPFIAHETVAHCPACSMVFSSDALRRWVAPHCNVAYDVLVFVGQALFQRHRSSREVRAEMLARQVELSSSEIEYLGRKFVAYLALGHRQASPRIRQAMQLGGGYILHLDATHEGSAPALMTGIDSLSKIVLANVKLPSEHAEHIHSVFAKD